MLDLDFVCLEYDEATAEILVEYKHHDAPPLNLNHASYRALRDLGDRAHLPVFTVRYVADFSLWRVTAVNGLAEKWVPQTAVMGEEDWVALLYRVRGRTMPKDLLARMDVEV